MNMVSRPDLFPPITSTFQRYELTPAQLDLVWDMNRGLSRREFDQFIETSRALGLNPFRRQICAFVLKEQNSSKRQFVIVTTIAGLRAIADRTGTYRPDSRAARMTFSDSAKNPRSTHTELLIVSSHRFDTRRGDGTGLWVRFGGMKSRQSDMERMVTSILIAARLGRLARAARSSSAQKPRPFGPGGLTILRTSIPKMSSIAPAFLI